MRKLRDSSARSDQSLPSFSTMQYFPQALVSLIVAALLCLPVQANASNESTPSSWPEKMVVLEQLGPLTRYQFKVRGIVSKGKVTGPAVVRAHVDATGAVVRTALDASCGNADLDEAALHGMGDMLFKPYIAEGSSIPVTLVVPVHVPKRLGRSN